jgi:hypothetical protein
VTRKRKRPKLIPGAITATPERMQMVGQNFDEMAEATSGGLLRKTGAIRVWTSLENLYRNKVISAIEKDAGDQYYRDHYIVHVGGMNVTMNWSDHVSSFGGSYGNLDAAERREFHRKRLHAANKTLKNMTMDERFYKLIQWVVVDDCGSTEVGRRARGLRDRKRAGASGSASISDALAVLAQFYGMSK